MSTEENERTGWRRHRVPLAVLGVVLLVGVGTVAKQALTRFMNMALYAKRSEGPSLLEHIRAAELRHFEQHGEYVAVGATPQRAPGTTQTPFESAHMAEWKRLGWMPDSPVRCQYEVTLPTPTSFQAMARCDADGDGQISVFVSSQDHPPKRTSPDDRF